MSEQRYPWFTKGDLNAFFGLMLDNFANLVLLTGILVGAGFDKAFIFTHMIPGTALGVMIGDLAYSWMARRVAKRTGNNNVTAMPLGLDTPSTIGVAIAVLIPVFIAAGGGHEGKVDATLRENAQMMAWQVGMATLILIGLVKLTLSFAGDWIRRIVPQAGLLGSLVGIGIALLGTLPLLHVFGLPIVGLVSLGLVLATLVAKIELPGKLPGAAVAVIGGTVVYYVLGGAGVLGDHFQIPALELHFALPLPTLGFINGLESALKFLPVAIPFGLLTVVGGINVTESARVAGDDFKTRDILLTDAVGTIVAGLTGGVAQSTPYIGHPAYKSMGGRSGYTLATGLFVGLGGIFGFVSFIVDAIPAAAVAPILIFVGLEIVSQTYEISPKRHFPAITLATLPSVAYLLMFNVDNALASAGAARPEGLFTLTVVGNGFILTAMLWGAIGAHLADRNLGKAAIFAGVCAAFSLFGITHSVVPFGALYLPGTTDSSMPLQLAAGYGAFAVVLLVLGALGRKQQGQAES